MNIKKARKITESRKGLYLKTALFKTNIKIYFRCIRGINFIFVDRSNIREVDELILSYYKEKGYESKFIRNDIFITW